MDRQLATFILPFIKAFVNLKPQVRNKYPCRKIGSLCRCELSYL